MIGRSSRRGPWLVLASLSVLIMTGLGAQTAVAQTAGTGGVSSFNAVHDPVPAPPAAGATQAEWATWAAKQRASMLSADWQTILSDQGCQAKDIQLVSAGPGAGTPQGVYTLAVTGMMTCKTGATAKIAQPGAMLGSIGHSMVPTSIPVGDQCRTITGPGSECVAITSYNGNSNYRSGTYKYTGSGSITGHVELSNEGFNATSCHPGTAVANTPDQTISSGGTPFALYGPVNYSTVWDTTFWRKTTSYSNWGDICMQA